MILKPHHEAILRDAPLYGHVSFEMERRKGFRDLCRNDFFRVAKARSRHWWRQPKELTPAGRACKRLLEKIPVDA